MNISYRKLNAFRENTFKCNVNTRQTEVPLSELVVVIKQIIKMYYNLALLELCK